MMRLEKSTSITIHATTTSLHIQGTTLERPPLDSPNCEAALTLENSSVVLTAPPLL